MIPEYVFFIFFLGLGAGVLIGMLLHAGLDDREAQRETDYMPSFWERRRYHQEIKQRPLAQLAAEGAEINEYIKQMEKLLND